MEKCREAAEVKSSENCDKTAEMSLSLEKLCDNDRSEATEAKTSELNVSTILRVEKYDKTAEMSLSLEKLCDTDRREIAELKTSELNVCRIMRMETSDTKAEMGLSLEKECDNDRNEATEASELNVKRIIRVEQLSSSDYPTEDKLSLKRSLAEKI